MGPQDHGCRRTTTRRTRARCVAHRTSPTNIGMGLLATLAAHDLGYIRTPRARGPPGARPLQHGGDGAARGPPAQLVRQREPGAAAPALRLDGGQRQPGRRAADPGRGPAPRRARRPGRGSALRGARATPRRCSLRSWRPLAKARAARRRPRRGAGARGRRRSGPSSREGEAPTEKLAALRRRAPDREAGLAALAPPAPPDAAGAARPPTGRTRARRGDWRRPTCPTACPRAPRALRHGPGRAASTSPAAPPPSPTA